MYIESIENINKEYNNIIKDSVIKEKEITLLLDGKYDYDEVILNKIRIIFRAYNYYIRVRNNRLYVIYLIT